MTQQLIPVLLFLALLACLPWLLRRVKARVGKSTIDAGDQSKFISAVAVGPHQRVVTVEVGPQEARVWLTLGVTAQTVNCLYSAPAKGARDQSRDANTTQPVVIR
jgi:flagellar protein FliO/FliZ